MQASKKVDSFDDRLAQFMARPAGDNTGLPLLQSEMRPVIDERGQLLATGPTTTGDRVATLTRFLDARMRLYDADEDIRAAYSVLARDDGTTGTGDQIKSLLIQIFALAENPQADINARLQRRNLQLELQELIQQQLAQLPSIIYTNDQLQYADTGAPVTSTAALKLDRTVRTRLELKQVAQRALGTNEFITGSKRVIALVPNDVDLTRFVRSDINKLFLVGSARGITSGSIFDSFRAGKGNCRVYPVTFGGGTASATIEVLVATRDIEQGEQLYRDYSDAELYKIWEAYNDTASTRHENTATGHNERRLRYHIGSLQLARIQTLSDGGGDAALDYQIRINLLSDLLL